MKEFFIFFLAELRKAFPSVSVMKKRIRPATTIHRDPRILIVVMSNNFIMVLTISSIKECSNFCSSYLLCIGFLDKELINLLVQCHSMSDLNHQYIFESYYWLFKFDNADYHGHRDNERKLLH